MQIPTFIQNNILICFLTVCNVPGILIPDTNYLILSSNNDILLKEANEFEKTTALIRIYLCFVVRIRDESLIPIFQPKKASGD